MGKGKYLLKRLIYIIFVFFIISILMFFIYKSMPGDPVDAMLGSLRYTSAEMEQPCAELSGGQRAKLLLASMALEGADVLILDEPTRNLSPLSGPVVRELLRSFRGTIISVSHDRKYLAEVCTRVYELREDGLAEV